MNNDHYFRTYVATAQAGMIALQWFSKSCKTENKREQSYFYAHLPSPVLDFMVKPHGSPLYLHVDVSIFQTS